MKNSQLTSALKVLSDMDHADRLKRYPTVPREAITARRFTDRGANALTGAILRFLELHGHWATRINTTGRQLPATAIADVLGHVHVTPGKWITGTTKRGTADIHAVVNGRHLSIEVKVGRDRMSQQQHKTKAAIEVSGGLYYVATDFQNFYTWYRGLILT